MMMRQSRNIENENKFTLWLVGNSRHSYGVYGVYSYGNCCQTLRVTKISINPRDDTGNEHKIEKICLNTPFKF